MGPDHNLSHFPDSDTTLHLSMSSGTCHRDPKSKKKKKKNIGPQERDTGTRNGVRGQIVTTNSIQK